MKTTESIYNDLQEKFDRYDYENCNNSREENLEKFVLYWLAELINICE